MFVPMKSKVIRPSDGPLFKTVNEVSVFLEAAELS